MFLLFAAFFAIMLFAASYGTAFTLDASGVFYRNLADTRAAQILSQDIARYRRETGTVPASLTALQQTAGYAHAKPGFSKWAGYALTADLTDPSWTYKRAGIYSQNPRVLLSSADFLSAAQNKCAPAGATTEWAFSTAAAWCGRNDSWSFRVETREHHADTVGKVQEGLHGSLQKFVDYFNKYRSFPSGGLAVGATGSLPTLAGYGGTAANCQGVYSFSGIPLDCTDLFSRSGQAVSYVYISTKHILLTSDTMVRNATGGAVVAGADLDLSMI